VSPGASFAVLLLTMQTPLTAPFPVPLANMQQQVSLELSVIIPRLNRQYQVTHAAMRRRDVVQPDMQPSYQAALETAQRAWLVYRNATCTSFGYEFLGAALRRYTRDQCLLRLSEARILELRRLPQAIVPPRRQRRMRVPG